MIVLGIESTAHTFGVGIADEEGRILANINAIYVPRGGGILPREAARHHFLVADKVLRRALKVANVKLRDLDAIAIALGPGMGPCLRVGALMARALAVKLNRPLVPVNHCVAHIEIARLTTQSQDPLVVYISGGNTIISAFAEGRYRIFGETLDIALGNFLDTLARELGLPQPGVPQVEALASKGTKIIELPYIVKGQDMSFSGLLTAALRKLKEGIRVEDLCLSVVEYAYAMLAEVAERALAHTRKKELVLTGGVARSKRLQEVLRQVAEEHDAVFKVVPDEYAGDNGAMIAWTGVLAFRHGITIPIEKSYVKQRWRLDEVEVPWRS
ncbi:MAG: bifunctional N(6)-L-threonylcarbamoyladenine synthase/serine/threonine protein kinase [Thermoprotei archaeon]|nr:MAG: bifunctional N(6)-L-threonylcarbamoyladenine synthase/serine/threonine protein kinase [Thermoprotei archaeon]RLF25051.1 MAG: bifunctional N(6)-L-threonylcarbamoyladenine synthase/serine/threonine protein kinase [Thermoprotei archaeon]